MSDQNKSPPIKGLHVIHRAYYSRHPKAPIAEPEILIGHYRPDGSCVGEFGIRWTDMGRSEQRMAQLEVLSADWKFFFSQSELRGLANLPAEATDDDVISFLLSVGYQDRTRYGEVMR